MDEGLRQLAERQHAAVARQQFRAVGVGREQLRHLLRSKEWEAATGRVFRLVGSPRTYEQDLMVAVLDGGPGTVASHAAAGRLWALPGFDTGAIEVSHLRGRRSRPASIGLLHLVRSLPPEHTTTLRAIPVTSLARTLFDIAPLVHPKRLERLIDTVTAKSPATLRTLHSMLPALSVQGRDGIVAMRGVLDQRPAGYIPPASGLEARFCEIIAAAGDPPFDRQVDLGGHDWIGRVDFVDRSLGLVVEIDSALHHTSRLDVAHDNARDDALVGAGWRRVLRISDDAVWRDPAGVVRDVRRARNELRLGFRSLETVR
jgi:very-short-patch-repair endonuclease